LTKDPKKICIFRLSAIGDIVLTTAMLRVLRKRFPEAEIHYIIKKQFASLFEANSFIDKLIPFDSKEGFSGLLRLGRQLRSEQYDLFIDIHKNIRSVVSRNFAGAKDTVHFKKNLLKRTLLTSAKMDLYEEYDPVFLRFIKPLEKYGISYDGQGTELHISDISRGKIEQLLPATEKKIAVLCPGASFPTKQWPEDYLKTLAQTIISKTETIVVFHGGPAEKDICEELSKKTGGISLAGKLNLNESAALTERADVVVVNDTGMLHISEAMKTPVVGIYGPTAKQLGYFPVLKESTVAEIDLPCRPCTKMGKEACPEKHFRCMLDLTPEVVFEKVKKYL